MSKPNNRKTITRQRFIAINRVIRDQKEKGLYTAKSVAEGMGVSESTVRVIARTKTFPKFEQYKAETQSKRAAKSKKPTETSTKSTKSAQDSLDSIKEIGVQLEAFAKESISREEVTSLYRRLRTRIENLENELRRRDERPFWRRRGGR